MNFVYNSRKLPNMVCPCEYPVWGVGHLVWPSSLAMQFAMLCRKCDTISMYVLYAV